ncbi:MAG: DUF3341 domain-containing protein [Gemmatimonadaceae bacterium]
MRTGPYVRLAQLARPTARVGTGFRCGQRAGEKMERNATFGVYRTRDQVEDAVNELRTNAFRSQDISVLFPDNVGTKDFAPEKHVKATERASHALVGRTLQWLVGVAPLDVPGAGSFIAAGPIISVMTGAGVGTPPNGLTEGLIGLGIPEYEARRYEALVKSGSILLTVHADDSDWALLAKAILERTGAEVVASTTEQKTDSAGSERLAPDPS